MQRPLVWIAIAAGCVFAARSFFSFFERGDDPSIAFELAGCAAVLTDRTCMLSASRTTALAIWISSPAGESATFTLDRESISPPNEIVQNGRRFTVQIEAGIQVEELRVTAPGLDRRIVLQVERAWPSLSEAEALRGKGELEAATLLLEKWIEAEPALDARSRATSLLARVYLQRVRILEAARTFEAAIDLARRAGRRSTELKDALSLSFLLMIREQKFAEARLVLDRAERLAHGDPEGEAHTRYMLGMLAFETGDYQSALSFQEDAQRRALRLAIHSVSSAAQEQRAMTLQSLGRGEEALALFTEMERNLPADGDPCLRARLLINLGWLAHLRTETKSGPMSGSGRALFVRARQLMRDVCHDRSGEAIALVNTALDALLHNDVEQAEADLVPIEAIEAELDASRRLELRELRARIALARGRYPAALAEMEQVRDFAELLGAPEVHGRAEVGRGQALEGLGRNEEAIAAYRAAEEVLDRQGLRITLSAGRGTFFGDRGRSARRLIGLLLRVGRENEACSAARRARLRAIRELERHVSLEALPRELREHWDRATAEYHAHQRVLEQDSKDLWALAESQRKALVADRARRAADIDLALEKALLAGSVETSPPSPPAAGELALAFHPLEQGWVVCAVGVDRLAATIERAPSDPSAAAAALIELYRRELLSASRVSISTYGATRDVDVHALLFDGKPLVHTIPVAYELDLSKIPGASKKSDAVLIIADPTGELMSAAAEGRWLDEKLRRESPAWSVELLHEAAATGDAVRAGFASARLVHFAGHGSFGGIGGWRAELPLAGGARLTVGDVLALEKVPEVVVLSGCETARSDTRAPLETLGLAQAFLLAGSRAVVAAVRPVDDRLAARVSRALYTDGVEALIDDPARALARAQMMLHGEDPAADWAAFRVLVR